MSRKSKSNPLRTIVSKGYKVTRTLNTVQYVISGNITGLVRHKANQLIGSKGLSKGFL